MAVIQNAQQAFLEMILTPGPQHAHEAEGATLFHAKQGSLSKGLSAYRHNGYAHAKRALSHTYPTVYTVMGDTEFAALARALWCYRPPACGDLAAWGTELPEWIAHTLAGERWPFLRDIACLDAACAGAEVAENRAFDAFSFEALAQTDPDQLFPRWAAGARWLTLPLATLAVRERVMREPVLAEPISCETLRTCGLWPGFAWEDQLCNPGVAVWVWRQAWCAKVAAIPMEDEVFWQALWRGQSFGEAARCAGSSMDVQAWLQRALAQGWVVGLGRCADTR